MHLLNLKTRLVRNKREQEEINNKPEPGITMSLFGASTSTDNEEEEVLGSSGTCAMVSTGQSEPSGFTPSAECTGT